jgi:hypothetical protein
MMDILGMPYLLFSMAMQRCAISKLTARCVNALSWSDDGDILLSGSDDKRYDPII